MPAAVALGQLNLSANDSRTGAEGLSNVSYAAAFDAAGDLWVADYGHNRVLEFLPPFTDDEPAAVVIGQDSMNGSGAGTSATNLSAPDGLAFDPSGDLWVSDFGNNRVLEFVPPFATGMSARLVLGQTGFTGSAPGIGPRNFSGPAGLSFNGSALWVSDYYSNRVLEFVTPLHNGSSASLVLGQSTLFGYLGGVSAVNLSKPDAVAVDAHGDIWVSDSGNNRVVEFAAPVRTNESASLVLGQPDLSSRSAHGASDLSDPGGLALDARGDVWVADTGHNRTLEFGDATLADGADPVAVLGQRNLSTHGPSASPTGENGPTAIAFDAAGDAWVVDSGNHRVLGYLPERFALTFRATGLPSTDPWSVQVGAGTYTEPADAAATLSVTNGSYAWNLSAVAPGFEAAQSNGTATVNGSSVTVTLVFGPFSYRTVFAEVGLLPGTNWSVTVGGATVRSTQTSLSLNLTNGSYTFSVPSVGGYRLLTLNGSLVVDGRSQRLTVQFEALLQSHPAPPIVAWVYVEGFVLLALLLVGGGALAVELRRRTRQPPPPVLPPSGAEPPP